MIIKYIINTNITLFNSFIRNKPPHSIGGDLFPQKKKGLMSPTKGNEKGVTLRKRGETYLSL